MHLAFYYLSLVVDPYYYPYLLVGYPFPLLHGPMLYIYTATLTQQHPSIRKQWGWHFIPALLIYSMLVPFFMLSQPERLSIFASKGHGYEWFFMIQRILVLASGVIYVTLSLLVLRNHKQTVKDNYSQTEQVDLIWLRYLIYATALVWVAVFLKNDVIIFSLVALFVLLLGYFGNKQVGIFTTFNSTISETTATTEMAAAQEAPLTQAGSTGKYLKSNLSEANLREIHQRLLTAMNEQRLFLNAELTITDLANTLAVHPNHLSQVINSLESKTFYDFINHKRVEEFKRIMALPESQKYTLLGLAFECGFNSKTAFYRNFKNITGQSPTQYLKQHQIAVKTE